MKALKTSIEFMSTANVKGIYDKAIDKQRHAFRTILRGGRELQDNPEEHAACAA